MLGFVVGRRNKGERKMFPQKRVRERERERVKRSIRGLRGE